MLGGKEQNLLRHLKYRLSRWFKRLPSFSRYELAYVAGVFDSDGFLKYDLRCPYMQFVSNKTEFLNWIAQRAGGRQRSEENYYSLRLDGTETSVLLPLLIPFLITKKSVAADMCKALKRRI